MKMMYIFESIKDMKKIKNTRIYRTVFSYHGSTYRLSSYILLYELTNGTQLIAYVNKDDANAVSGTGVSGIIAYIDDIQIEDEVTPFDDDFVANRERSMQYQVNSSDNKAKIKWIKSLMAMKPNKTMTPEFYKNISTNHFMASLRMSSHSPVPYKK